ncbi:MAG: 1-acyl-sn-glycerol-3-phosphate acyltransferase [Leptospirales bacterium]|jgi:1-acyl-sn-glycerol-3-phosphate acyltransferase|nr:1-acyl-sn-glycerol-3-phosphate acyltransferase [Leptospirales bacterium]
MGFYVSCDCCAVNSSLIERNKNRASVVAKLPHHPGKTYWPSRIVTWLGQNFMRLFFKIKVEGHGNFPESGPLLILAKHQRLEDIPLGLGAVCTAMKRRDQWCVMKHSLADPKYFGFFLKCGGIPIDRRDPQKSKGFLLLARHKLHEGNTVVIFPEQTFFPSKMGKGKVPGFRFVAGRPDSPIQVGCIGFTYKKGIIRTEVTMRLGKTTTPYTKHDDAEHFLHDRMLEIAELSSLHYPHPRPEGRKAGADMEEEEN